MEKTTGRNCEHGEELLSDDHDARSNWTIVSWWVEGEDKDQIAKNEEQEGNTKRKEEPAGSSWADDGPPSLYISLGMYTH